MKKLAYRFSGFMVAALIFVAQVSPFCFLGHYQSEVPASLRK
ncbi:MAG: cyclic lactone autoinducer peptide [Desulfotomaculaceae bacterium]|nr:cyclic lactone autoinducer peptide [Desulfotomaculaceae bacterium]